MLIMNGDADWIIDRDDDGSAWAGTRRRRWKRGRRSTAIMGNRDGDPGVVRTRRRPSPLFRVQGSARVDPSAISARPAMTLEQIRALPTINSGTCCDATASSWNGSTAPRCISAAHAARSRLAPHPARTDRLSAWRRVGQPRIHHRRMARHDRGGTMTSRVPILPQRDPHR